MKFSLIIKFQTFGYIFINLKLFYFVFHFKFVIIHIRFPINLYLFHLVGYNFTASYNLCYLIIIPEILNFVCFIFQFEMWELVMIVFLYSIINLILLYYLQINSIFFSLMDKEFSFHI